MRRFKGQSSRWHSSIRPGVPVFYFRPPIANGGVFEIANSDTRYEVTSAEADVAANLATMFQGSGRTTNASGGTMTRCTQYMAYEFLASPRHISEVRSRKV